MTTSLELSKALFEKGLKIETEKVHRGYKHENGHQEWWILDKNIVAENLNHDEYPAPSTDELLTVMPQYIFDKQNMFTIVKDDNETYWVAYSNHKGVAYKKAISEKFLPEALGKMCLWLLDNGYIYDEKDRMIRRKE